MSNPNHASDGKFSSSPGAADGDPSKEAQATRAVPGSAKGGGTKHIDRRQVTTAHAGSRSVGHSDGGSGGGGGGGGMSGGGGGGGQGGGGGSGKGGGLSAAARDRVIRQKGIDARHYGTPGDLNRRNAAAGSQLSRVQGVSGIYSKNQLGDWEAN
jgi:hypothetical protein